VRMRARLSDAIRPGFTLQGDKIGARPQGSVLLAGDQPPLSLSWLTLDYPSISTRADSEYQQRMYANLDPE
jgi:hypothetical protein